MRAGHGVQVEYEGEARTRVDEVSFRFFTWYSGGGLSNYCFRFNQCLAINLECKYCASGPLDLVCNKDA